MASYDDTATVSGSVVSIENGADDVPTKAVKISIPPTLSGKSEVTETQTGRNLLDVSTAQGTGTIWFYYDNGIKLKKGVTYTFSCGNYGTGSIAFYALDHTTQVAYAYISASSAKVTYTPTEDIYVCPRIYQSGLSVSGLVDVMLEYGSTAHAFEPYQTPTQYTASLGRTIYGGTADIVNGTGTDETNKFTVTSDMSGSIRYIGSGDTAYIQINNSPASNSRWQDLVCSHFAPANIYAGGTQQGIGCYSSQFYIRDSRFTSKQDFLDFLTEQETLGTPLEICYKLATPTGFTFDGQEIPTRLGYNAFWSDSGDTELTYYKSGYGFTSVTVHKETPEGEPVVQTVKFHRIVYGGQADVVRGICEPRNLAEFSNEANANRSSYEYATESPELIEWTKTGDGGKFYARFVLHIQKPGKYTISCSADSTLKVKYIYSDELWGTAVFPNVSANPFVVDFSESGDYVLGFYAGSSATSGTLKEVMCEKGGTKTDYAPYSPFFTFPPISTETDEGENTLFANEGDSAITYRKAVD